MKSLARRLFSSLILISFVLATLFVFPLWVFALAVSGFILLGLLEFFTMVRRRGILVHRPLAMFLGTVFVALVAWRSLIEPGLMPVSTLVPATKTISWLWDVFWPAAIFIVFIRQFTRDNTFEALSGITTTLFGLAYIGVLLSYLFYIRAIDAYQGAWLVCFLILVTKMGDAGAYMLGNLIGRHALSPRISPKKTWEGFAGAVLASAITALIARSMLGTAMGPVPALGLGAILGVVGQLGDLSESLIKRDCQVSDTSALMPGLGGILDVIDSLLFTAPLFYGFLIYG